MPILASLVPLFPLAVALVTAAAGWRRATAWFAPLAAAAVTAVGAILAVRVLDHGPVTALDGLVRVDALSAFMVLVIGLIALIATSYGVAYIGAELDHGHTTAAGARTYGVLVELFVAAMLAAVLANNLGVLWVAVEATTIATAFLVGHRRTRASLEASWKYMVIGSVGVALAFFGTVLVYFASRHAGGDAEAALNWTTLVAAAPRLDPGVMRLAVGLLVLGYGTKVGLAPMHTWLPDAHSQAPAPVSALMSGVLLSVAFYALLRYKVIADAALGPGYLRGLLVAGALLSLAVAASLLIAQRDYKRLLAYHSIEHMGLIALATAIGSPLAVAAALLHILGHGLAKAIAFCISGEILLADGTTQIAGVRGLLARRPLVGGVFGLGLLALLGMPPFSLFASELAIARAGLADGLGWVVAVALVFVLVIFATAVGHAQHMLLGEPATDVEGHHTSAVAAAPLVTGLVGLAALVAGHDDGERLRVVYVFTAGPPDQRVELRIALDPARPSVPSLGAASFPAGRFEREMHDLFGVEPVGHPRPARLVLHQHWPEAWHPMRREAGDPPPFADEDQPYPFLTVEGPGVYEIPVGPVHAGLIEPGHFRFSVVGETILNMKARLWFVHKGIERLFEGRDVWAGVELAERISGDSAVGHNLAYCLAVEDACGSSAPAHAHVLRAILLELERLYNHVADVGALCNDVGFGVAHAHALRIREQLLRLNAEVTGHRLLRGGVFPGGANVRRLPTTATLDAIAEDFHHVVGIALANSTVVDRFTGTAVLTREQATEIGTLGYVARASGVGLDARQAHPFADLYAGLDVPVHETGDVLARFRVRVEEFDASIALLRSLLTAVDSGARGGTPLRVSASGSSGVGIVEGWRGTIVHRVELATDGVLTRVKVVDPSFLNWPALPVAMADTIVPDFPLANKSFNLSYAGNDL